MMVIFVSQCEKNALKKTRRVLDAFANRIGDNTWQTVITEDGLQTVKKMLRQTASKSTAVSCHWLRSRSRCEFLWVVGSKEKFNQEGVVPVNSTTKEIIMDTMQDKAQKHFFYANTHLQSLAEHSFAVGQMAKILCRNLIVDEENKLSTACFVAGCLHDIGKVDLDFQEWVQNPKKKDYIADDGQHIDDSKFSFEKHARHNELSLLIYVLLENDGFKKLNKDLKIAIKHAIYWHHAKPYRKNNEFSDYSAIFKCVSSVKNGLLDAVIKIFQQIICIDKKYGQSEVSILDDLFLSPLDSDVADSDLKDKKLPDFKQYSCFEGINEYRSEVIEHAKNDIVRACLVTADRVISELSSEELHNLIKNNDIESLLKNMLSVDSNLSMHISECLKNFPNDPRGQEQSAIAEKLTKTRDIAVLAGAAGCGKTKISLEWAMLKKAKKILWICPRVQVCQGLFYELTSDQYLPNANIEINTGEFKFINRWGNATNEEKYFSGDIVVTTIDQIFSAIITHSKVNTLVDYLNAHVVFDEYHEYVNMPAFNLLFAELIECKKERESQANTLLVSATPHYLYIKELLNLDQDDIKIMPSFNQSAYKIDFQIFDESKQDDSNPLYQPRQGNAFVISNTAQTAQKSFLKNQGQENAVLLHSKFKKSDKKKWFEEVYRSFQKEGNRKFDVLRSGPIVQASLNITCDNMVSEMTNPENFLQRLGRLDRFGENDNQEEPNILTIAVTQDIIDGKCRGPSSRFLNQMHSLQSSKAWYNYLNEYLIGRTFKLKEIYDLYKSFYKNDSSIKMAKEDLISALKNSVREIHKKIIDPIKIMPSSKKLVKKIKISKASLRGDNRFVQMAVYDVTNIENPVFTNEYAYTIPDDDTEEVDNITASRDEIEGYGNSDKNLLAHMVKKHHNVIKGKKAYKDTIFLNQARDPEFPIYLSYTPKDLDKVGGESARHTEAIYYVVCEKQPIGAMSIQQLNYETE